jgi:hypothetical protein
MDGGGRERGNGREMEKPKVSGYSSKSLLRSVDLPVPEGPETTTGRNFCAASARSLLYKAAHRDGLMGCCVPVLVAIVETGKRGENDGAARKSEKIPRAFKKLCMY